LRGDIEEEEGGGEHVYGSAVLPAESAWLLLLPLAMSLPLFLALAIAIRVLLDLTGMVKSSWRLDVAYCMVFAGAAVVLLTEDQRDLFGYACMLLCAGWGIRALIVFRRQSKNRAADH
jgi:steroid 5-alpha reductase family enzyme